VQLCGLLTFDPGVRSVVLLNRLRRDRLLAETYFGYIEYPAFSLRLSFFWERTWRFVSPLLLVGL